ncbi:hypothetical protein MRX96_033398 [Rhipicephalus microplus]
MESYRNSSKKSAGSKTSARECRGGFTTKPGMPGFGPVLEAFCIVYRLSFVFIYVVVSVLTEPNDDAFFQAEIRTTCHVYMLPPARCAVGTAHRSMAGGPAPVGYSATVRNV